jgi:DNA polymerase-3 subunit gamma/tau
MTELLLAGDYTTALIRFDEVLSKGFSGQTFMAGLNQHMRDLLLAKGPAISLIELTGTLLERYRAQAAQCDTEFLFGAISLLTEADGKIKQSSNQRLLVELGLMKIASLGKKKNDANPLDESYPLPDLPDKITPAGGTTVQAPQTVQATQPMPSATESRVEQKPTEVVTPKSAATPTTPRAQRATPTTSRHSSIAGFSIASLMDSTKEPTIEKPKQEEKKVTQTSFDPQSEQKIADRRGAVIEAILRERPRFVVAFENMTVADHTITVEVPSQTLYEEIMRSKTEVLLIIARTAGITGSLELEVKVNEQIKVSRPIKLEDRIKHMTEKNPLVLELKKELDMEYE